MTRSKKRGFTLVELLVVIAILAILATVSVVGYTKFTKKAKQSNDVSLTTQINTALQADEITGKPATLTEAIKVMDEVGANIAKLSPTTEGYSYVWNSKTNRVVLLDEKKGIVAPEGAAIENELDCFAIIHKAADLKTWEGYSYYLAEDYTDEFPALTYLAGVDVGTREIENISITSDSAGTVIVYTNGGILTVNAPNATVNHYGTAESVDIQAIYEKSYHEYGTITGNITIAKGHFVAEAKSSAAALIVTASNGTVSVELKVNSKIAAVAGTGTNGLEGVTITGAQNTTVYEGQYTETTDFAGGLGTEASPYLIANATQMKKMEKLDSSQIYYFKQIADIEYTSFLNKTYYADMGYALAKFNGVYDGNGYTVSVASKVAISSGKISLFKSTANTIIKNLTVVSTSKVLLSVVLGDFDTIKEDTTVKIENVTTTALNDEVSTISGINSAIFISSYIYNGNSNNLNITLENCNNYVSVMNNSTSTAAFIGSMYPVEDAEGNAIVGKFHLVMKDCNNYGNITSTGANGGAAVICGHSYESTFKKYGYTQQEIAEAFTLINIKNYGTIKATKIAAVFTDSASQSAWMNGLCGNTIGGTYVVTEGVLQGVTATLKTNGTSLTIDSTASYTFKISFGTINYTNSNGDTMSNRSIETDELAISETSDTIIDLTEVKAYDVNTAKTNGIDLDSAVTLGTYICSGVSCRLVLFNSRLYVIFSESYTVNCNVKVFANAYDTTNGLQGSIELN